MCISSVSFGKFFLAMINEAFHRKWPTRRAHKCILMNGLYTHKFTIICAARISVYMNGVNIDRGKYYGNLSTLLPGVKNLEYAPIYSNYVWPQELTYNFASGFCG
jgi:hypothetical protein